MRRKQTDEHGSDPLVSTQVLFVIRDDPSHPCHPWPILLRTPSLQGLTGDPSPHGCWDFIEIRL